MLVRLPLLLWRKAMRGSGAGAARNRDADA
jgi:hypothetical protein